MSAMTITRTTLLAFAVLGAVGLAPVARASHGADADEVASGYPARMTPEPKDAAQQMDVDGKGYVTREEYVRFQQAVLGQLDGSGDRKLAAPEFTDRG